MVKNVSIHKKEFEQYDQRFRAKFINSLSGFKSCNLVGTQDCEKVTNLAIISSVFHLGASPALMGFIIRPSSSKRDTLDNIITNSYFTINHVNESILMQSHQTSARYPSEVSEFSECKLTEEYIDNFSAPFVKESVLKLGMKLLREVEIKENGTHLIIASIEQVTLPEQLIMDDGHIDISELNTICVNGLDEYYKPKKIGRLSYAKPDKDLTWIDKL